MRVTIRISIQQPHHHLDAYSSHCFHCDCVNGLTLSGFPGLPTGPRLKPVRRAQAVKSAPHPAPRAHPPATQGGCHALNASVASRPPGACHRLGGPGRLRRSGRRPREPRLARRVHGNHHIHSRCHGRRHSGAGGARHGESRSWGRGGALHRHPGPRLLAAAGARPGGHRLQRVPVHRRRRVRQAQRRRPDRWDQLRGLHGRPDSVQQLPSDSGRQRAGAGAQRCLRPDGRPCQGTRGPCAVALRRSGEVRLGRRPRRRR